MLNDAVKLVQAADYVNAGTVEFLVSPEDGQYHFIECNPRIQVEPTVTEQVTGIDLVEAQFHIAGGASLASLGLAGQGSILARGFAIQVRVVAQGAGSITGYKEPSGAGIRVAAAHAGGPDHRRRSRCRPLRDTPLSGGDGPRGGQAGRLIGCFRRGIPREYILTSRVRRPGYGAAVVIISLLSIRNISMGTESSPLADCRTGVLASSSTVSIPVIT